MAFQAGEVVMLKSGGMQMTVAAVDDDNVQCLWLGDEGDLFRETLPASVLELVLAAGPQDDDEDEKEDDDADDEEDEDDEDEDNEKENATRKGCVTRCPLPSDVKAASETRLLSCGRGARRAAGTSRTRRQIRFQ
jgi:uncharacterized protein YodC (DUF2158 family)